MKVLAFCRSPYHVKLLQSNFFSNEEILIAFLSQKRVGGIEWRNVILGSETSRLLPSSFRKNIKYYEEVKKLIGEENPDKIIIFNTYTPLAKYLLKGWKGRIELWEDGMNHYICEHNGLVYYFKAIIKLFLGYSWVEFWRVYSSTDVFVRDRFDRGNLNFDVKSVFSENARAVYVGQPIVEDGFVSGQSFISGMKKMVDEFGLGEMVYIPHPRERNTLVLLEEDARLRSIIEIVDIDGLGFDSAEAYLVECRASMLFSAFSTVNMNVEMPVGRNFFVPSIFNLKRIKRSLGRLPFLNVEVC
ncbi:hypothetical protein [Spongiibacter marinus]|uniref:hypothetical protein n=1 Tax=Spongiibacter marinus TaxID=354246 RepID=UPI0019616BED|nr:hypothetical protein [Spongiibacter marinus]MBM7424646.1 mannitol/fructose-specific phosphotransferase system IIA component [Spongiibacter marinus]